METFASAEVAEFVIGSPSCIEADQFNYQRIVSAIEAQLGANGLTKVDVTGTLVVDMIDASSKSMLERGVAAKQIDAKAKPDERDKKANKAAAKISRQYPPKRAE